MFADLRVQIGFPKSNYKMHFCKFLLMTRPRRKLPSILLGDCSVLISCHLASPSLLVFFNKLWMKLFTALRVSRPTRTICLSTAALRKLLKRLVEPNNALNADKSVVRVQSVNYLGYTVHGRGITPGAERFAALINAPEPTNASQLRSSLGFLQHCSRFIAHLSSKAEPLFQQSAQFSRYLL